jgi:hypothetical protein
LEEVSIDESSDVAKFDFSLTFEYKPLMDGGGLSCDFVCSRDLYDEITVAKMAQRFQHLFGELFSSNSNITSISLNHTCINRLTLILPAEADELQDAVFYRRPNVVNEGMSFHMNDL